LQGIGHNPSGWVNQYKNICVIFFSLSLLIFELHLCHIRFCSQEQPVEFEEQPVEFEEQLVKFLTNLKSSSL